MIFRPELELVQYFREPDEADHPFGRSFGRGGGGISRIEEPAQPVQGSAPVVEQGQPAQGAVPAADVDVRQLLDNGVVAPTSVDELGQYLTARVNEMVSAAFKGRGHTLPVSKPADAIVEASYEKARARLSELMAATRANLVATITKRGAPGEAVALVDWRALDLILDMAQQGLQFEQRFGDLAPETVEPAAATAIARLDIHRPLAHRQTAAERRALREALSAEPA